MYQSNHGLSLVSTRYRRASSFQVNVLEPHPNLPVLATSGLDHEVKVWFPDPNTEPHVRDIEQVMQDAVEIYFSDWYTDGMFFTEES